MPDEQDRAEAIDEDEVGAGYPPEEPLGVDEAQEPDSFLGRGVREEPEAVGVAPPVVQPYAEDDLLDDESELVADAVIDGQDPEADDQPPPAEEAALHLEP